MERAFRLRFGEKSLLESGPTKSKYQSLEDFARYPLESLALLVENENGVYVGYNPTYRENSSLTIFTVAFEYSTFMRVLEYLDEFSRTSLKCVSRKIISALRGNNMKKIDEPVNQHKFVQLSSSRLTQNLYNLDFFVALFVKIIFTYLLLPLSLSLFLCMLYLALFYHSFTFLIFILVATIAVAAIIVFLYGFSGIFR